MQQKTPFTDFTTDVDVVYTLHISPPPLLAFGSAVPSTAVFCSLLSGAYQHEAAADVVSHIVSTALDPVIFSGSTIGTKCAEKTKHSVSLARPKSFEKLVI